MKKCLGMFYSALFVVFLCSCLFGCSDKEVSKDVSAIKSRLEKIEDRLANIEKSSKKTAFLEVELRKLQQSMDAWERAITARFAPVVPKKAVVPPAKAVRPEKNKKVVRLDKNKKGKRAYVVKRGDSLFRIAQQHNMSVDQLCSLNKINAKAVLHAGTKLWVILNGNP